MPIVSLVRKETKKTLVVGSARICESITVHTNAQCKALLSLEPLKEPPVRGTCLVDFPGLFVQSNNDCAVEVEYFSHDFDRPSFYSTCILPVTSESA
jgi:hypothetical protein